MMVGKTQHSTLYGLDRVLNFSISIKLDFFDFDIALFSFLYEAEKGDTTIKMYWCLFTAVDFTRDTTFL